MEKRRGYLQPTSMQIPAVMISIHDFLPLLYDERLHPKMREENRKVDSWHLAARHHHFITTPCHKKELDAKPRGSLTKEIYNLMIRRVRACISPLSLSKWKMRREPFCRPSQSLSFIIRLRQLITFCSTTPPHHLTTKLPEKTAAPSLFFLTKWRRWAEPEAWIFGSRSNARRTHALHCLPDAHVSATGLLFHFGPASCDLIPTKDTLRAIFVYFTLERTASSFSARSSINSKQCRSSTSSTTLWWSWAKSGQSWESATLLCATLARHAAVTYGPAAATRLTRTSQRSRLRLLQLWKASESRIASEPLTPSCSLFYRREHRRKREPLVSPSWTAKQPLCSVLCPNYQPNQAFTDWPLLSSKSLSPDQSHPLTLTSHLSEHFPVPPITCNTPTTVIFCWLISSGLTIMNE